MGISNLATVSETRVLFDTNIWSTLVHENRVEDLFRLVHRGPVRIVAAPSVAYELLRTSNPQLRANLAKAITRKAWLRLPPDAYTECGDLFLAARRYRPEWIANHDHRDVYRLYSDWMGAGPNDFWGRARREPNKVADTLASLEGDVLKRARFQTLEARREVAGELTFERLDLSRPILVRHPYVPGYSARSIDLWRVQSELVFRAGLLETPGGPYRDWLTSYLDLAHIRRDMASWFRFWFDEVSPSDLPIEWIRTTLAWVQRTRKVTPGTPGDNQLASYLHQVEVCVTADGPLAEMVDKIAPFAPVPLARPIAATGRRRIDRVLEIIDDLKHGSGGQAR